MSEGVDHLAVDTRGAPEQQERTSRASTESETSAGRRQFLGALGSGVAATMALPEAAGAQETPIISMGSNYFDPVGLAVEPGTTVRFEVDTGSHSATAYEDRIPPGATPFDSGTISEGGFEHTFETSGTYDYYCIPHRSMGMTGRIVVGEPGGPAEATPIPDGDVPDSSEIVEQGRVSVDGSDGSGRGSHGGMMGSGPGMMGGGGHDWRMLVPVGFFATILGLAGGAVYGIFRRQTPETGRDDTAVATLEERYARGNIDEEEFERRLERLNGKT